MDLLGINRRNTIIADLNPRAAIALANDKLAAKDALQQAGLAVPETLACFAGLSDISIANFAELPEKFVVKPTSGSKGLGIAILTASGDGTWNVDGELWDEDDLRHHLHKIFVGEFTSSGAHRDTAYIEEVIEPHPIFDELGAQGLADIRIICFETVPVQAMLRLPTRQSGGKANLHRGAIGMALDIKDGSCPRAWFAGSDIETHPDTGEKLVGFQLPMWEAVLENARVGAEALGLGYAGSDLVLTEDERVLTLEVNAFPGIEIQNVNAEGLRTLIEQADGA